MEVCPNCDAFMLAGGVCLSCGHFDDEGDTCRCEHCVQGDTQLWLPELHERLPHPLTQ